MKSAIKAEESAAATDPTEDIEILLELSALHGERQRENLASERDGMISFLSDRRNRIALIAAQVEARRKNLDLVATETSSADTRLAQPAVHVEVHAFGGAAAHPPGSILEIPANTVAAGAAQDTPSIEERAELLASNLSPTALRIYRSLVRARKWPFAVDLNGDSCGRCNMRLPGVLVADVRKGSQLHLCPFCKRVLAPGEMSVWS